MAISAPTGTVCARFQNTARRHADAAALREADRVLTWGDYAAQVRSGAAGMAGLGLRKGDVVACWLSNRPEFHVADAAAMHLGATSFSIYNTFTAEQARSVVADSGACMLVTEPAYVEAAIAIRDAPGTAVEHIVCVEGDQPEGLGWDELLDAGEDGFDFDAAWQAVAPGDLATLIYTSGTSGPPKGVEITHANLHAQTVALTERLRLPDSVRAVSFLPMAHIAERLCTHYLPMLGGWQVTCCPDPRRIGSVLLEVRPGYFFSPPRVWEKLRSAVLTLADPATLTALEAAADRVRSGKGPQDGEAQIAVRASVGFDALEVAIVGAAPCPEEVLVFWHASGVHLSELYGMSETTGAAAVAGPGDVRIGTVGPPLDVCEVSLSEAGEVLVRGPVVMRGYRDAPGSVDADGWLHSGDTGALDADGHLRIVDRMAAIEAAVKAAATLIGQACVIGDGRPYNVALLTLDPQAAAAFAARVGASSVPVHEQRRVLEAVAADIAAANARLADAEQVRRFVLLPGEWLPDSEELTPMMKLRRRPIAAKYAAEIEGLYAGALGMKVSADATSPLTPRHQ